MAHGGGGAIIPRKLQEALFKNPGIRSSSRYPMLRAKQSKAPPHNEEGFLMTRSESEWKAYHQALWSTQLRARGVRLVFLGKGEGRRWSDRKWKRMEGGEKDLRRRKGGLLQNSSTLQSWKGLAHPLDQELALQNKQVCLIM